MNVGASDRQLNAPLVGVPSLADVVAGSRMSGLTLRPYQLEALAAIESAAARGVRRALLAMATGLGKTIVFAELIRRRAGRALVLVHRDELVRQAVEKLGLVAPLASLGVVKAERDDVDAETIVASVQTLARDARLRRLPSAFDTVIVDESHHLVADTYQRVLDHLRVGAVDGPLGLGVTATPERGDGLPLDGWEIVYRKDIRAGIREGYLCDLRAVQVRLAADFGSLHVRAGDFVDREAEALLLDAAAPEHALAAYQEHAPGRKGLIFTPTVKVAHAMADAFRAGGIAAEAIDGGTPLELRRDVLARFQAGDVRLVANCAVLTEGFDEPSADCIIMARPTKSRLLYLQCLDAETEILTEQGWRGIDDDLARVAAYDPETGRVHWSQAEKVVRLLGGEPMYGIENPHLSLRVTAGHRMLCRTRRGRARVRTPWKFVTAERVPSEWCMPLAGVCDVPDAPLSDAEVFFLGFLLTDGSLNRRNGAITLVQSEANPEVVTRVFDMLKACGFKFGHRIRFDATNYGPRSPLHCWWISRGAPRGRDAQLSGWRRLAAWVSPDGKSLTPAFETLSVRQVGVLLEAMRLANGSKHPPATGTKRTQDISLANERLGSPLQSLFVRRGYRCNIARRRGTPAVVIHVGEDIEWSVKRRAADGRPTWGPVPSTPDERVWCATVDTGAIIVRRHGKVAVVGNCLGRGTRLFPGKNDCLVIDVVGATDRHDPMTAAQVLEVPPRGLARRGVLAALEEREAAEARAAANGRLVAESIDLFRPHPPLPREGLHWVRVGGGRFALSLNSATLILTPGPEDRWRVLLRERAGTRAIADGLPLEYAQGTAEDFARKAGAGALVRPGAAWRGAPASEKQRALLRKWRVPIPVDMTKGAAADAITAQLAVRP